MMNWANRVTLLRIVLVPVFITAVSYHSLNLALVIFILAAITDGLDGYLARTRNEKTKLGSIIDPIADKMLIGSAFICFSLVKGLPAYLEMPVYVPIIVISRDVIILAGAMIVYLLNSGIDVRPSVLGKITTVIQMLTVISLLLRFPYSNWMWNTTAVVTVASGLDYLRIGSNQINGKHS
ncbi:MAG: CDP-alcohol phosphatidyltransferase family protein [Candidatus Omnitrophota bacterium]